MRYKTIEVEAGKTQEQVENGQCDVIYDFETVREAKQRAKYWLTDEYMCSAEMSEPLGYARVVADDQVIAEFWR